MKKYIICSLFALFVLSPLARAQSLNAQQQLAHDIFKQLIEIDTTNEHGSTTPAAQAVAERLKAAGFADSDIAIVGPNQRKMNLVARIHGTGQRKPIVFLAHLDVVEAKKEDWSSGLDPFKFTEKDGYYYGRGTSDIKDGAAVLAANFIRLKQEGFKPDRDLILALTADEEGGDDNGVQWLLKNRHDLIDAEYCINLDAGEFQSDHGKRLIASIQAAEKTYTDYDLLATNKGGHSSRPVPDNAIYQLAHALTDVEHYQFPVHMNEVTTGYFAGMAELEKDPKMAADMKAIAAGKITSAILDRMRYQPYYNAMLHTTCVATMVDAGHAHNALPQRAHANVNCRIIPGETPEQTLERLRSVIKDPAVKVSVATSGGSIPQVAPLSPLRPEVTGVIKRVVHQHFPEVKMIPAMGSGATDGKYMTLGGIPTYGVSGLFDDINDVRAHGRDERIAIKDFYDGLAFNYDLVKALGAQ